MTVSTFIFLATAIAHAIAKKSLVPPYLVEGSSLTQRPNIINNNETLPSKFCDRHRAVADDGSDSQKILTPIDPISSIGHVLICSPQAPMSSPPSNYPISSRRIEGRILALGKGARSGMGPTKATRGVAGTPTRPFSQYFFLPFPHPRTSG